MANNQLLPRGQYDTAGFANQIGREKCFEDLDWSLKTPTHRTQHDVRCRLVKNSAGIALEPGRLVTFKAGTNRTEVDGYATTTAADGKAVVVVDEFLPASGVPANGYFWVVTHGPAECLMPLSQVADISEDSILVALTAATSGSTTAGRVGVQSLAGATAPLGNQINGAFGRALSAKSSSATNERILVFMSSRWD